jgi:hypothetical protein
MTRYWWTIDIKRRRTKRLYNTCFFSITEKIDLLPLDRLHENAALTLTRAMKTKNATLRTLKSSFCSSPCPLLSRNLAMCGLSRSQSRAWGFVPTLSRLCKVRPPTPIGFWPCLPSLLLLTVMVVDRSKDSDDVFHPQTPLLAFFFIYVPEPTKGCVHSFIHLTSVFN